MFANAKVATRLAFGFGLTIALLLVVAFVGGARMQSLSAMVSELGGVQMKQIEKVGQWEVAVLQTARHMRNVFLLPADQVRAELEAIRNDKKERAELLDYFNKEADTAEAKAAVKVVADARAAYIPWEDEFLKLAEAGNLERAKVVMLDHARPAQLKYVAELAKLRENEIRHGEKQVKEAAEAYRSGLTMLAILATLAVAAALAAGYWITLSLTRQLGGEPAYAAQVATLIAAGDLTVEVQAGGGDTRSVLAAMKKMRDNLAESVNAIQIAADNVNTGSKEIARGNADLSSRTEEQASSLEETASSMEELTTTVKQNAENARQANQLAIGAADIAGKGGNAVRDVVNTMTGISEASKKIADIISVIDGIAFQTNILALNAAVEAARAGEQGRGFAVVASEVRALAQRSAGAAKEIKTLIEDSVSRVNDGTKQVDGAGRTMEEIVTAVKRVTDIVSEISAASQEQLTGIEQVNKAIMQMDQVVQQNAALVEESAAAAENLASQSEVMAETVGKFKLDGTQRRIGAAPSFDAAQAPAQAVRQRAPRGATSRLERRQAAKPALVKPMDSVHGDGNWKEF